MKGNKKIDLASLKYVVPIFLIPVFLGFFYLYNDTFKKEDENIVVVENEIRGVNDASSEVQNADLKSKLEAYQDEYREGQGVTAIQSLSEEEGELPTYVDLYSDEEKRKIYELEQALKQQQNHYNQREGNYGYQEKEEDPLTAFIKHQEKMLEMERKEEKEEERFDPIENMKKQFAVMDSIEQSRTPEAIAARKKELLRKKQEELGEKRKLNKLTVQRKDVAKFGFNTIKKEKEYDFIKAIIDEEVTGYAGSRVRIRLLEDIFIGENLIKKGTYLYAEINGFSEQRVTLKITGLMFKNKILPIELAIYDMDGMEGLYVPSSQFRELTKELGSTTLQGQDMGSGNEQDFLLSTAQKTFQSTSNAIAAAIRKNKVKLKYNSYIYLIDKEELKNN